MAGRPLGSTNKPKISDYVTPEEITELVNLAIKEAKAGKVEMLKFMLEQILGKARQNIGLDGGEDDKPIRLLNYIQNNAIRDNNGDKENTVNDEEDTGDTGGHFGQ